MLLNLLSDSILLYLLRGSHNQPTCEGERFIVLAVSWLVNNLLRSINFSDLARSFKFIFSTFVWPCSHQSLIPSSPPFYLFYQVKTISKSNNGSNLFTHFLSQTKRYLQKWVRGVVGRASEICGSNPIIGNFISYQLYF